MDVALPKVLSAIIQTMPAASMVAMIIWVSPVLTVTAQERDLPTASELSDKIKTLTVQQGDQQPTLILTTDESILDISHEMLKTSPNKVVPYRENKFKVKVLANEPAVSTPTRTNPAQTNVVGHGDGTDMMEDLFQHLTQPRTWLIILLIIALVIATVLYRRAKMRKHAHGD